MSLDKISPLVVDLGSTGTANQFDNSSNNFATTAFVQRALGNYQSLNVITSPTTLTASNAGSVYSMNVGSSITLPLLSTVVSGAAFTFW